MSQFTFHTPENSEGERKTLLQQIKQTYGFSPNLFAYMAEAPVTIEAYLNMIDLISKTSFTPAQQQVALLAASIENECDFCTTAHRALGKMSKANQQTLDALHTNSEIKDKKDKALALFVKKVVNQRGKLNEEEIQQFLESGFSQQQILEAVLIVAAKTLSNYINHFTSPEPNKELLAML